MKTAIRAVASAARTATGNMATPFDHESANAVAIINVTAASGTTPTLVLQYQETVDDSNFVTVAATDDADQLNADITTTGAYRLKLAAPLAKRARFRWVIGGSSPSFTFSVTWLGDPA